MIGLFKMLCKLWINVSRLHRILLIHSSIPLHRKITPYPYDFRFLRLTDWGIDSVQCCWNVIDVKEEAKFLFIRPNSSRRNRLNTEESPLWVTSAALWPHGPIWSNDRGTCIRPLRKASWPSTHVCYGTLSIFTDVGPFDLSRVPRPSLEHNQN